MDAELSLRRSVLAGKPVCDSYDVMFRGYRVGHIMRDAHAPETRSWSWGNARMPDETGDHGQAASFAEAKAAFRDAWVKPADPLTRLYWLRERLCRPPDPADIRSQTRSIAWDDRADGKS